VIQDIGPPRKEGRTRFLSVCTLLRTPQLARFVGSFPLLFVCSTNSRRCDGGVPRVISLVSPRRIHDFSPVSFGESTVSFGAIQVSLRLPNNASRRFAVSRKDKCVLYLSIAKLSSVHAANDVLSPVLNSLPGEN